MDALGLQTLASELAADVAVAVAAFDLAERRVVDGTPAGIDSAAHHVSRGYNVVEQMALRVAKVRPPLFTDELRQPLQELRAFRHVFVHAYDLTIDPEKLTLILKYGRFVRDRLPKLVSVFVASAADEQGIERPQ